MPYLHLALSFLAVLPLAAQGLPRPGDVLMMSHAGAGVTAPDAEGVGVFDSDGNFRYSKRVAMTGEILATPGSGIHATKYASGGFVTYSAALEEQSVTGTASYADLTMDREETIYAVALNGAIHRFPRHGGALPPLQLPISHDLGVFSADLAADQCTLFFVEASFFLPSAAARARLRRHDLCRDSALPDVLPAQAGCIRGKVRVSYDGSVFFAACANVFRITSDAIRSYEMPSDYPTPAIAVAADGQSFWWAGRTLLHVEVATGALLRDPIALGHAIVEGLAIYGVPRAAYVAGIAAIPAGSSAGLLALAAALLAIAYCRLLR